MTHCPSCGREMAEIKITISDVETNEALFTEYIWCKNGDCRDFLNNIKTQEYDC